MHPSAGPSVPPFLSLPFPSQRCSRAKAGTEAVLARVKGAKKLPGVDNIFLPGEGGSARAAAVVAAGEVSVEKNLYDGIKAVSERARVCVCVSVCVLFIAHKNHATVVSHSYIRTRDLHMRAC